MRAAAGYPALKMVMVPERHRQRGSRRLQTVITSLSRDADQQSVTRGSSLKSTCSSRARRAFGAENKELDAGNLENSHHQLRRKGEPLRQNWAM